MALQKSNGIPIELGQPEAFLEVIAMMGIYLFLVCCFLWLIGLALLAEFFLYEEEQQ
ncbi:MAG: hypothetical protein V7L01_05730 [Nostoc sp.]|uniref:hypothetical protein n=1 Tax=Nostoc sp. TaxID=1180 RepID=UPI002FFD01A0